jgi:hypothetical protein
LGLERSATMVRGTPVAVLGWFRDLFHHKEQPVMPSSRRPDDPLHAMLGEAESDLSRRLQEACEADARGVHNESSAEIRRLEDTLLAAAMAAERTLAARRHLDAGASREAPADAAQHAAPDATPPARPESDTEGEHPATGATAVREFEDEQGRGWRAWPVTPNLARAREASRRSLGDFQEGWICFEALDNSGRRRLPRMGRRWSDLPADELRRLLAEAITVPARKSARGDAAGQSPRGSVN